MRSIGWILSLTLTLPVFAAAQPQTRDIRVTGEYTKGEKDTPDSAKRMALLDAKRKAIDEARAYFRGSAAIEKLRLSQEKLDAYILGLVDATEQPATSSSNGNPAVYQVQALAIIDTADIAHRIDNIRNDAEAAVDLQEIWKRSRPVWQQFSDRSPDWQISAMKLGVDLLLAQASVALSRQETGPISTHVLSEEGRKHARQLVEQALALDPANLDAHQKMGDVLLAEGRAADGEKEFRNFLLRNPNSSLVHDKLGNALQEQGESTDAIAEFRQAIQLDSNNAIAHSDLGLNLRAGGKLTEALVEFREATRIDPDYVDGHNNLAITLANQGDTPEAIVEFREIIRISPGSPLGHYNTAIALADMEKDMESIAEFRETLRITPNQYNAHFNLGEMLRLQGDLKESAHEFGEYVRLAPNTPEAKENIERAKSFIEAFKDQ